MDLTPGPFPNPGTEHPGRYAREGEKSSPPHSLIPRKKRSEALRAGKRVWGIGPKGESISINLKRGSPTAYRVTDSGAPQGTGWGCGKSRVEMRLSGA